MPVQKRIDITDKWQQEAAPLKIELIKNMSITEQMKKRRRDAITDLPTE